MKLLPYINIEIRNKNKIWNYNELINIEIK